MGAAGRDERVSARKADGLMVVDECGSNVDPSPRYACAPGTRVRVLPPIEWRSRVEQPTEDGDELRRAHCRPE